jgi:hypothetical protein
VNIDLGDIVAEINLRIKGKPGKPRQVMKWGPHRKTVPADRVPTIPQPYTPRDGKVDRIMQLQSDKKVAILGLVDLDEMGNEIGASAEQPTYSTDDVAGQYIVLTDNGDGTGEVAATGTLTPEGAPAPLLTATFADGSTTVEAVNIVVGDVASREFRFGPAEEVTPDAVA